MESQRYEFQAETRRVLELMVNSVYSNRDIFLRELISNASDALDKLRFLALTDKSLERFTANPVIRIEADAKARVLTVSDNGIGMNRDEITKYLGTIAKSGTGEFVASAAKDADGMSPELIGRFGVGFYASFMVAESITVLTRRAGEEQAWLFESNGDGSYTITPANRDEPGSTIILRLKPEPEKSTEADGEGEEFEPDGGDYTDEWKIRSIVRKYSDFVGYPIKMKVRRTRSPRDEKGEVIKDAPQEEYWEDETLNSMKAIWTRPEAGVTDEEYKEFYRHITRDWQEPQKRIVYRAEGATEFRSLLFIPARAPFDIHWREGSHGVDLYIRRVFIMRDCKELLPEYLRFVRGVVDSEDLSLNISREILQKNPTVALIRKALTRKLISTFATMRDEEREGYLKFWDQFGTVVKEGLYSDQRNREDLLSLCLFYSSSDPAARITVDEYINTMPEGQDDIWYVTAKSATIAGASPHLEAFRDRGWKVLFLTDPIDSIWVDYLTEYKGKRFRSVMKEEPPVAGEKADDKTQDEAAEAQAKQDESQPDGFAPLFEVIKTELFEFVKEVRASKRLTSSPVCLVSDEYDMTPQLEQILRAAGQDVPKVKRVLELNIGHEIARKLHEIHSSDPSDPRLKDYSRLLYGSALLAEGLTPPDPAEYTRLVADLMKRGLV